MECRSVTVSCQQCPLTVVVSGVQGVLSPTGSRLSTSASSPCPCRSWDEGGSWVVAVSGSCTQRGSGGVERRQSEQHFLFESVSVCFKGRSMECPTNFQHPSFLIHEPLRPSFSPCRLYPAGWPQHFAGHSFSRRRVIK